MHREPHLFNSMKPEQFDKHIPEKRVKIKRSDGTTEYVTKGELAALNERNKVRKELHNSQRANRRLKQILLISWIFFSLAFVADYLIRDTGSSSGTKITNSEQRPSTGPGQNVTSIAQSATVENHIEAGNIAKHEESLETPPEPLAAENTAADKAAHTGFYQHNIVQVIHDWASAWSSQDIKGYLAFYSQRFSPDNSAMSYQQWTDSRKARLQTPDWITVNVDEIEIIGPGESGNVTARFRQDYLTNSYQDRTLKELVFARENENWLIVHETSIKQLPQQAY